MIYLGYTAIQEELSNHENLSVKCAVKMREKLELRLRGKRRFKKEDGKWKQHED